MVARNLTRRALSFILPAGVFGASVLLATAQAATVAPTTAAAPDAVAVNVADRLAAIRKEAGRADTRDLAATHAAKYPLLAYWLNFGGWGWRNGGWHNWGNGWHNGWHNWGNGWHNWGNGWHNYWHNW